MPHDSSSSWSSSSDRAPTTRRRRPRAVSQWSESDLLSYLDRSADLYLGRFASSSGNLRQVLRRRVLRLKASLGLAVDPVSPGVAAGIDKVVANKVAAELINDRVYTQNMVASLRSRGSSTRKILQKLHLKGIPVALAQEQIAAHGAATAREAELEESLEDSRADVLSHLHDEASSEAADVAESEEVSTEGVATDELNSALRMVRKLSLGRFRSPTDRARPGKQRARDGSRLPRTEHEWQQRDMAKLMRHGFSFDVARRALVTNQEPEPRRD
jgi:regulatory protein